MKIIDISLSLSADTPLWPGSPEFRLNRYKKLKAGDECNNSYLALDVHTGTHIDAPSHFLSDTHDIDQLPLDTLIGPATVYHLRGISTIRATDLESLSISKRVQRLLLRTDNSELWNTRSSGFKTDYVGLTSDAAQWIADSGIRLIGIDYLSVAALDDMAKTHQILLRKGIVLLEGINLSGIDAGEYELICLPLKIIGAEGAPARAVLRKPAVDR
ncbi:MAG: cyclase family protein [Thermodesulfobacteriota bacterium]